VPTYVDTPARKSLSRILRLSLMNCLVKMLQWPSATVPVSFMILSTASYFNSQVTSNETSFSLS